MRSDRVGVAFAWSLALLFAGLALAGWWRDPPRENLHEDTRGAIDEHERPHLVPERNETAHDGGGSPLRALTECLSRVERLRAAADRETRSPHESTLEEVDAGISLEARACLERADVARIADERARSRHEAAREQARVRRAASARAALTEALGLPPEDLDWIGEHVCAVRRLGTDTLDELGAGGMPRAEAVAALRREREAALADVEARLGPERYAALRALGGVGLLADTLRCDEP